MEFNPDNPGVVMAALALFAVIGIFWWIGTVLWHFHTSGPKHRRRAIIGIQLNLVLILFAWLLKPNGILFAVLAPWYPPLALYLFSRDGLVSFVNFLATPLAAGAGAALVVGLAAWFFKPTRLFTLGLAGVTFLLVTTFVAIPFTRDKIDSRARALHADCLAQSSIWDSRVTADVDPQFDLHAVARIDGKWFGWSYSQADFYPLSDLVNIDKIPLIQACAPLN